MSEPVLHEQKVRLGEVSYQTYTQGQGDVVLLLHGFTGSAHSWSAIAAALAKNFTVVTVDILGHGQTSAPTDCLRYQMEQVALDLTQVMVALEHPRFSCLGYSMGGRLAIALACLYPQQVKRLIVESGSPGLATAAERQARRTADEHLADWLMSVEKEQFVDYWEQLPIFAEYSMLPLDVQRQVRAIRLSHTKVGLAGSLRGMGTGAQPSFWDLIESLTLPVLLLTGETDKKFCTIAEKMKSHLPTAQVESIFAAGHAVHLQQTEVFIQQVHRFLRVPV
ncbi:2-succinyl-6-hydroxy-2,4-cyclohexadiene-1-carboxylate synthase [Alicyclobacillaceae bacterium I2511]|nr:2-succinyl-6-hydroxy-2,4-cyclohexadiene-1-carboxylate synthase [Alicyclobacillaceae bacterium I2511]